VKGRNHRKGGEKGESNGCTGEGGSSTLGKKNTSGGSAEIKQSSGGLPAEGEKMGDVGGYTPSENVLRMPVRIKKEAPPKKGQGRKMKLCGKKDLSFRGERGEAPRD